MPNNNPKPSSRRGKVLCSHANLPPYLCGVVSRSIVSDRVASTSADGTITSLAIIPGPIQFFTTPQVLEK